MTVKKLILMKEYSFWNDAHLKARLQDSNRHFLGTQKSLIFRLLSVSLWWFCSYETHKLCP